MRVPACERFQDMCVEGVGGCGLGDEGKKMRFTYRNISYLIRLQVCAQQRTFTFLDMCVCEM